MKYNKIKEATFVSRENRFVATVDIVDNGKSTGQKVHVKNTGRCKELLVKGAKVYLEDYSDNVGTRKYAYSLVAVNKGDLLINMDSQAPNKVVKEALEADELALPGLGKIAFVKPEYTYGQSRLDFYVRDIVGKEGLIEVKGVTLEKDGHCFFPDAPTTRGIKHLRELEQAIKEGFQTYAIFVIQFEGALDFAPNDITHEAFGDTLRDVRMSGVNIIAIESKVTPDSMVLKTDGDFVDLAF